jgi:glucosamine--fructose-6-phosphate aminotransferase (isomerizing)
MCGIVGYVGKRQAKEIILEGLTRLEYRGYDSAGLSIFNQRLQIFDVYKDIGRVNQLREISKSSAFSNIGIGHTRWATHGKVSKINAHPHQSYSKRFVIVHNGVIENYQELKAQYLTNTIFESETDTEVIAQLIETFAKNLNVENAILTTLKLLKGSYALLILDTTSPEVLYAAKHKSPLILGQSNEGITIASDLMALVGYADTYVPIEDKTFIVSNETTTRFYDLDHHLIHPTFKKVELDESSVEKGAYAHFMLKEIHEQPSVVRRLVSNYLNDTYTFDQNLIEKMRQSDRIYVLAAGTSMHAGFIGKRLFESLAGIPTEVHIASEFAYQMPLLTKNPFFVLVSQSGETADLRACLVKLKKRNYEILTITNVITSTLAREANYALELFAGPEIAVASTKAYVAQVGLLAILANELGARPINLYQELTKVALAIENFLSEEKMLDITRRMFTKKECFYIGRGVDYYIGLEAALKLKEISYIHTEGFAAGELKHGTIALIEEDTPVVAIISDVSISSNTRSNLKEVEARGAKTLIISMKEASQKDDDIVLNDVYPLLSPMVMVIPTQLFSYYAALVRSYDIDKPRNLAKSVTVE